MPLAPTEEMLASARDALPELPAARRQRYVSELGLPEVQATQLAFSAELAAYFESALEAAARADAQTVANWTTVDLVRGLREAGADGADPGSSRVSPQALAELADLAAGKAVSSTAARQVLASLIAEGGEPGAIVEREGLGQMEDSGELEAIVERAISAQPQDAENVRSGNMKAIGPLVGFVMRETNGRADGGEVTRILREKLLSNTLLQGSRFRHTERVAWNVVITGGGFAGMSAARELERLLPAQSARLVLVNDVNFLLYTPFLPEAAAGTLEPRHVVTPLRDILHRTYLRLGAIAGHDPEARTVDLRTHEGEDESLRYDQLAARARLGLALATRSRGSTSMRSASRAWPMRSGCETT